MKERDLREDMRIDRYALEEEAAEHASIYHYWADKLAKAKSAKDQAQAQYNFVKSEVELEYRREGRLPGDIKITEASISSEVTIHKRVMQAEDELNKAKKDVYHLEAAVNSMENRKREIDNLVTLYVRGYYNGNHNNGDQMNSDDMNVALNKRNNKED
jgi:septal ring factor EnvC (AmiA/AmiB activator)